MAATSHPKGAHNENAHLVDYTPGADQTYLSILHACFGQQWGDLEHWRNKHVRRPGFDPRDVKQFLVNGVPASCFHVSIVSLVLEPGLHVQASFGGDLAVLPEFRRQGMIEDAHQVFGKQLYDLGVAVRCSFTTPELHARVYSKKLAHIFVPTVTATYRKILSSSLLAEKILVYADSLRQHRVAQHLLRHKPLTVVLRIPRYDPCVFMLTQQSTALIPAFQDPVDIDITLPYRALAAIRSRSQPALLVLTKYLFSGELRMRGIFKLISRIV